jgi:uncharacterized membrane protein (Fun14 family)
MDTKAWWQSKTIWGTIITFACLVLQFTGVVTVSAEEQATVTDALVNAATVIGQIVGLVLVIIGRIKAATTLTAKSKPTIPPVVD